MKKTSLMILSILFVVALAVGFIGCTPAETDAQTSAGESKEIWYSTKNASQLVHVVMADGVKVTVEQLGFNYDVSVAESDAALQNVQMNNLIDNIKPAAIILNPYDSDSVSDIAKKSKAAGIPIAVIDNAATNTTVPLSVLFDSIASGVAAGEEAVRLLEEKYGEAKGVVVNLYGEEVSQVFRERKEGFEEIIAQYPNIELISVLGGGNAEGTQNALTNIIAEVQSSGKTIDLINSPTDDATLGAVESLKIADMWYPVGDDKHVSVVSHDGMNQALRYLEDGYFDSVIVIDIMGVGGYAVEILEEYTMKGKEVPTSGTYTAKGNYLLPEVTFSEGPTGPTVLLPSAKVTSEGAGNALIWGNQG